MSLIIISSLPMADCTGGFMSDPNSEYNIPDGSIQASSILSPNYKASYGRLHGNIYWIPGSHDRFLIQAWIQADLGRLVNVYGIQTQGSGVSNWVTTLKVSTSQTGPELGDGGDFIQDGSDVRVCIKRKTFTVRH